MDWYSIVKFIHVFAAILWLGGGFTMLILGTLAERSGRPEALMASLQSTAVLGNLLFMPASLATLVFGFALAFFWTGFSDLWLIIGMAGAASTFVTGVAFIKPTADKLKVITDKDGMTPDALLMSRQLMRFAKFDYAVMIVIVADMVIKPGYNDYAILGSMTALIGVAVALYLVPRGPELATA